MRRYTNLFLKSLILFLSFGVTVTRASSDFSGNFLELGGGARGTALGNSYVAISNDATSAYWNPSGLTSVTKKQLHLMHSERFSGQVKHDFLAYSVPTSKAFNWGIGFLRIAVPDIAFTQLSNPSSNLSETNRPIITSTETSADHAIYVSGAKYLREKWSIGTSLKFIYRTIADYRAHGIGLDIGSQLFLRPNFKLGFILRDVTNTTIHWNTNAEDNINPSLICAGSYTIHPFGGTTLLAAATKLGGTKFKGSGIFPFSISIEHSHSVMAMRFSSENNQKNFGIGFEPYHLKTVDITYTQHQELDSTYQLSANISF